MEFSGAGMMSTDSPERQSVEQIRDLQLKRLRWSIRHAWEHVAHYRQSFADRGVHPDDLRTLEDLAKFPFLTKQDFRVNYPFDLFAVPREKVVRIHTSSGTTGKPTVVGYTARDIDTWTTLMARCIRATGARTGDIVHIAYDYGLFTGGLGSHGGAERLGCTVIPVSSGRSGWQVELIEDFRPDILMATPSYALNLAEAFARRGLDAKLSSLRIGIFGAEPWTEATRAALQAYLGLEAFDLYGLAEILGPGVACETAGGPEGLTLWEDHIYPEVIDPHTGRVLSDGEEGELVLTTLSREALPVIRYRTRDLTRLLPPQGGPMRRIARVFARTDDMLVIHGINVFPSQLEALIAHAGGLSPHYKLEINRQGPLDELTLHVETLERQDEGDAARRRIAAELTRQVETYVGVSIAVAVHRPRTLERAPGKTTRLIERRTAAR
ncbi:MAG: AMP-binding protein [Steroidobacteraceae bacterium]